MVATAAENNMPRHGHSFAERLHLWVARIIMVLMPPFMLYYTAMRKPPGDGATASIYYHCQNAAASLCLAGRQPSMAVGGAFVPFRTFVIASQHAYHTRLLSHASHVPLMQSRLCAQSFNGKGYTPYCHISHAGIWLISCPCLDFNYRFHNGAIVCYWYDGWWDTYDISHRHYHI